MIISLDAEKTLNKIQHSFKIKVLERPGIQRTCLKIIKAVCSKSIDNIKLHGDKLKAIVLKSETSHSYPLSPYLFDTVLEVLVGAIQQLKEIKGLKIWKERS